jgi:hypothetical protein
MQKLLAVIPAVILLAGCPSFTTMGTARTTPLGKTQLYVATGGVQLRDWRLQDSAGSTGTLESVGLPQFEIGVRHGVSDTVEVGGKIWFLGAELDSKFQLLRSPGEGSGIDVALAPALSLYPFTAEDSSGADVQAIFAWAHLPLLVGVNIGGGSQLVIGPRLSDMIVSAGGETTNVFWAGGSLGLALKMGPTFRILPEVSIAYPVAASHGAQATTDLRFEGVIVQGMLGLLFGP